MSKHFRPQKYFQPTTIKDALEILNKNPSETKVVAGGTDLLVTKPPETDTLLDISRLPLSYIRKEEGSTHIGATTNFNTIMKSEHLQKGPLIIISETARALGHYNLRHLATLGGNICNAVPSADSALPLIALDSDAVITGLNGDRIVKLEDFFTFVRETVLGEAEILKEIVIPSQPLKTGTSFKKIGRTNVDIAIVNAAVRLRLGNDDTCKEARIVLGAVAPTPIRVREAEALLTGKKLSPALIMETSKMAASETKPISDVRAGAEYRREMSGVLVKRALEEAYVRAKEEQE